MFPQNLPRIPEVFLKASQTSPLVGIEVLDHQKDGFLVRLSGSSFVFTLKTSHPLLLGRSYQVRLLPSAQGWTVVFREEELYQSLAMRSVPLNGFVKMSSFAAFSPFWEKNRDFLEKQTVCVSRQVLELLQSQWSFKDLFHLMHSLALPFFQTKDAQMILDRYSRASFQKKIHAGTFVIPFDYDYENVEYLGVLHLRWDQEKASIKEFSVLLEGSWGNSEGFLGLHLRRSVEEWVCDFFLPPSLFALGHAFEEAWTQRAFWGLRLGRLAYHAHFDGFEFFHKDVDLEI